MDYWVEKETPANTAKSDALETEIELVPGTITEVWIFHPPGCFGLAYATIVEGIHQLYPTNSENAYHGDGYPMQFKDNYDLKSPANLKLITWNLDDTYAHSVYVRITILHAKYSPFEEAILAIVKKLAAVLGVS
jgi:hypothetical protein